MARQKGIIALKGTIGGLNFYQLNGTPVVRKAGGGFNGKTIKTSPTMQRVRENGSEFGHSSSANRVFRNAILSLTDGSPFANFHRHLMPLFAQLKSLDTLHIRGQRKVSEGLARVEGKRLFKKFAFTPDCAFANLKPFDFSIDAATYGLHLRKLSLTSVKAPKGATHISLHYGVLAIDFDGFETQLSQAAALVLPLSTDTSSFDVPLETPVASTLPFGICLLGVRYYQQQDSNHYLLNAKESIGLLVLDVCS